MDNKEVIDEIEELLMDYVAKTGMDLLKIIPELEKFLPQLNEKISRCKCQHQYNGRKYKVEGDIITVGVLQSALSFFHQDVPIALKCGFLGEKEGWLSLCYGVEIEEVIGKNFYDETIGGLTIYFDDDQTS